MMNYQMNSNIENLNNNQSTNHNQHIDDMKTQEIQYVEQEAAYQPREFKFNLPYLLESKDKGDIKSEVSIRGSLNDDGQYDVWRKILRIDKKEIKMSPSWLSRQREGIAQGILIRAFGVTANEAKSMKKSDTVKLCYDKLKMLKASKKLEVKALMLFTKDEIKLIQNKMLIKYKCMDLVTELFNYFASQSMNLENEYFMDILDDCILHKGYESAICEVYVKLHHIMLTTKTPSAFDSQFISFQKNRINDNAFKKLLNILNGLQSNPFRTYNINNKLLTNIYIYSILDIYLTHVTCVVYELIEIKQKCKLMDNTVSEEQSGSFGGSSFCSCQRIAYSRHLTPALRKRLITLQRVLLCQESERDKIAIELQYEGVNGFYYLSPSLYPFCKRILSSLAVVLNRHLLLPSVTLPDFSQLIHEQINNKQNIEEFKRKYPPKILSKYNEDISKIYERFVTFMCRKFIFSKLKQADFGEVGLSLRDQFNFGHMQYIKQRKK
eukprot:456551_1